jgi:hypothetical protein
MKKFFALALSTFMASTMVLAQGHEDDRLRHSGEVLMEILNIPDNLPKPVLDKSECVIVIPSVKKLALGVGGNYGRGAMTCRSGKAFTGPWGPPAMVAMEGANIGFQIGGQATDFVLLIVNPKGIDSILKSKVKLARTLPQPPGPSVVMPRQRQMCSCTPKFSPIRVRAASLPASLWMVQLCVLTTALRKKFTATKSLRVKLCWSTK